MKKDIKISEVLQCLEDGMSREEIAAHFGITMVDCKRMFKNPLLKGKKAKKQAEFNLIDDVSDGEEIHAEINQNEFDGIDEQVSNPELAYEDETPNWEN